MPERRRNCDVIPIKLNYNTELLGTGTSHHHIVDFSSPEFLWHQEIVAGSRQWMEGILRGSPGDSLLVLLDILSCVICYEIPGVSAVIWDAAPLGAAAGVGTDGLGRTNISPACSAGQCFALVLASQLGFFFPF